MFDYVENRMEDDFVTVRSALLIKRKRTVDVVHRLSEFCGVHHQCLLAESCKFQQHQMPGF